MNVLSDTEPFESYRLKSNATGEHQSRVTFHTPLLSPSRLNNGGIIYRCVVFFDWWWPIWWSETETIIKNRHWNESSIRLGFGYDFAASREAEIRKLSNWQLIERDKSSDSISRWWKCRKESANRSSIASWDSVLFISVPLDVHLGCVFRIFTFFVMSA